jgi:hypothetical protein
VTVSGRHVAVHVQCNSTRTTSIATWSTRRRGNPRGPRSGRARTTPSGKNYLTAVAHDPDRLVASVLLHLAPAGTSVGIAVALYPVLI